jgi:hypothetical protein
MDHAMAYDAAHERIAVFGGQENSTTPASFWMFGVRTPASLQPIGTGCAGTSGVPVLTSTAPRPGSVAFRLELTWAPAQSPCLFGLSTATQTLPIGPCTLFLRDPIHPLVVVSDANGFATTPTVQLPPDPGLRGATVYAQAFVADPQGPVLGLAFSQGLRIVFGD